MFIKECIIGGTYSINGMVATINVIRSGIGGTYCEATLTDGTRTCFTLPGLSYVRPI